MVEEIINKDNIELIRALYLEVYHQLEDKSMSPAQAREYMRGRIRQILAYQGTVATEGSGLDKAIASFCHKKVEELVEGSTHARMQREDKEKFREWREEKAGKFYDSSFGRTVFGGFARKVGHDVRTVMFSIFLLVLGIAISAVMGNTFYLVGFLFWSFQMILPNPQETKMVESDKYVLGMGSLLANKDNRTNTGFAVLKAICRMGIIVCFVFGLYSQPFPMSNLILLFMAFGFYFSLPVEFQPSKPYDFMLSMCRVFLAIFIAFFIFGGIFRSTELQWLSFAFLFVLPVATEKESLPRALGLMGKASGESYEMIDKLLFIVIMVLFLTIGGGFSFTGGFFVGTAGIIFSAVWILGVISGLMTPAETRPWMGIIILIVGFVVFGLGAGQQAMGTAFFGQWWPTVHNTANEFLKPIGDMFSQFQMTFGQTFLLMTNPVAYAQQITQGTYTQNELGVTGAYGLEIRKFDVQSIYIDEPFMIQIELENKGIYKAKNINVKILTSMEQKDGIALFKIGTDPTLREPMAYLYKDKYEKKWYKYEFKIADIERQDATPIFLYGFVSCKDFDETTWKDFKGKMGIIIGPEAKEHTAREYFVPFVLNVTYDYEATSNLQIDFISNDEWKRLSADSKLVRTSKASLISTSPASLNLGSMDQPIKEDSPFYVGFNLTTTWPKNTLITGGVVEFNLSDDFIPYNVNQVCTKEYSKVENKRDGYTTYKFDLTKSSSKDAFCSFSGLKKPPRPLTAPMKTYTIYADAAYTFSKWESKDTLFNFKDVCWPR